MPTHSPEVRAAALAELATGASVNSVANKYGASRTTIRRWEAESGAGRRTITSIGAQQKKDLGVLTYDMLVDAIETIQAQLRLARDPKWVQKQSAGELGSFIGITADKVTRLLAAFRPVDSEADAEAEPGSEGP